MKVYKVTPCKDCNPCTEKDIEAVKVWLEEADPTNNEVITIEPMEMSEEEYDNLPEHMGP
jgi:hypothetical protein